MNRIILIFLILLFGTSSKVSFSQDIATNTFKIAKIYATVCGLKGGKIDRKVLADSGKVVIHGCPECKVKGFQLAGKTLGNTTIMAKDIRSIESSTGKTHGHTFDKVFKSKSDLFTPQMKTYILSGKGSYVAYYIEIFNIVIITSTGEKKTLDKICFNLQ